MNEPVDRRILAAFRCVDAISGNSVDGPLAVSSSPWLLKPNQSGVYVVFDGPGFDALTTQFVPATSPWPAAVSFEVSIADPSLRYLPRRAMVGAPSSVPAIAPAPPANDAAKTSALNDPTTVFCAQSVTVYPSPAAPVALNWSVVRASVVRNGTTQGLPWAVLQIVRSSDSATIATGMTNASGEGLLAVAGLKLQIGQSPVQEQTVAATIHVWFDPASLTQPSAWTPNPDDILKNTSNPNLKSATQSAQLGVGQELITSIPIAV